MLSLSHLALLETSQYLFVIRWNKNWMQWRLKELYHKVQQPTPWCAGMVVVNKNGGVRICIDLKPFNWCVLRGHHALPKVDDILGQLTGATVFSKLDANSGFWQVPLAEKSRLFITFITPFRRYCYNKLPFGISSTPEHFQWRMHSLLEGLPGVLCVMDDILIFGTTQQDTTVYSRQCWNIFPQLATVENVNFAKPVLCSWDMSLIREA